MWRFVTLTLFLRRVANAIPIEVLSAAPDLISKLEQRFNVINLAQEV